MASKTTKTRGVGLLTVLFVVFLVLKLTGVGRGGKLVVVVGDVSTVDHTRIVAGTRGLFRTSGFGLRNYS